VRTRIWSAATLIVLSGCGARVVDVGQSGGGDSGTGQQFSVTGNCTTASCANQILACADGTSTPTNLQCSPHADAGAVSTFAGTCVLTGDCPSGVVTTCTTTPLPPPPCHGGDPCAASVGGAGSGLVSVEIDSPAGASASAELQAFFAEGFYTDVPKNFGACAYNPRGASLEESGVKGPAPNPGTITVTAANFTGSLNPLCDGTYPPSQSTAMLVGGALVSFAWARPAGNPYRFPTADPNLPAPHFIALGTADALAASAPALQRGSDVPVTWTVTGAPLTLEQVVVKLTQDMATVTCSFASTAGSGVVPADALLQLSAGPTTYTVYAEHQFEQGGPGGTPEAWDIRYMVQAVATTPTGLAKGTLTLQ
jgi:hypothetical protein